MQISVVYDSFILERWYNRITVILEITKNMDFFQNTCFKENNNMKVKKIQSSNGEMNF